MSFYLIATVRPLMMFYWRQMMTTFREIRRHRRQIGLRSYVYHQIHTDHYVKLEMTVEQPETCKTRWRETIFKLHNWDDGFFFLWKWPGLSALNRSTTYPLFGTATVSFSGGLANWRCSRPFRSHSNACFRLILFTFVSGDRPMPMTWNDVPCKWNGWLRFVCWTVNEHTVEIISYAS